MKKAQINRVRAATFNAIKEELADEWNSLPRYFYIYKINNSVKTVWEIITAATQINDNHLREMGFTPQTVKIERLYTINKNTKQAF